MKYRRPTMPTEGQIQAEFYRKCRNNGIEIHLEYYDQGCRFDGVVVRGESVVAIIECKRQPKNKPRKPSTHEDSQRRRYGSFGVPLVWVRGLDDIERAYAEVRAIIAARSGGGWRNTFSNSGMLSSTVTLGKKPDDGK